ncbi:aminotransferase class I/II-fold pyridoxal phosphate-dependent enzyme [Rouxiella badensis]|uniref:aminotransferase class I/II-fold pyridoxal phosphate-dependent enzyme n=1 Tax=Rouxiella badensis TaxID=1646377 RepID=UPI001D14FCFC|nr:aminotransferase class I/II-fold pyridoxal phosphate-dependent enzyme [Rouxiella badensis]MCC3705030.1 aminotransferase class I/II-fold pyridoxal phosphate-dependent enzyme [Rouxiella badensis]MCC3735288.1 aminotransferase class I/II-fold pyridoxal phosphate-dependent enzyme [Rouxiella badensis]MCC3760585.1 aminotransferase class I/II-fold pyridoxal phosphate-dependent enzyme [Rouxiella badensis]
MSAEFTAPRLRRVRPSPTAVISDRVRALSESGVDVINLGEGELDFDTPDHIKQAGIDAIVQGDTKYTAVAGTAALKKAIINKFSRENQLTYQPNEVIAGSGAKQLIFNALLATVSAGQEVLIPAPYWVSYPDMVALADGEPRIIACTEDNGWKLQADELKAAITPETRWLILNSPNNPTGAVYSTGELRALAEVLLDAPHVLVMADDIYEHLCHQPAEFATLAQVEPRLASRILTVNGVSKGYSMTGWRIGYAGGPAWLISAMQILQSQSTSNPSSISQAATVVALEQDNGFLADWREALDKRRRIIMACINQIDGLSAELPPGAFYVFANCSGMLGKTTPKGTTLASDVDFVEYLLDAAHVATLQGSAFGASPYLRIAYAIDDLRLDEACERIVRACAALR